MNSEFALDPSLVLKLLRNVRNLRYPISKLHDAEAFESALASDLTVTSKTAMTLLGYLLEHDYVRIIPDMGLVVNQANEEIQRLVASGQLEGEACP